MFSTSADAGEGSSAGATASGQQPVMFGGISSYHIISHGSLQQESTGCLHILYLYLYLLACAHDVQFCLSIISTLWSIKM